MARQARKTMIGAFVVGAVGLAAAAVIVFGSGRFFQNRLTFVMYFSGSITGLTVGAPVEFRGVRVGQVTKIAAVLNPDDLSITIPVHVDVDPKSLVISGKGDATAFFSSHELYEPLLQKGLRAQLDVESFITRQLYINMDFYPDKPAKLFGLDPQYPEIPTIPSLQEEIVQTLHQLPGKIITVADGIDRLVNSSAAEDSLHQLAVLVRGIATEAGPLMANLGATSRAARRAFAQAEKTLSLNEGPPAEMANSFIDTMAKAGDSLDQIRATLRAYQALATQNASVGYDVTRTLGDLDAAARSMRSLAQSLELHPESILKGRR